MDKDIRFDLSNGDGSRRYYVTVKDGGRTGWLLGPFLTHGRALSHVSRAKRLANDADPRAAFYAFGTASAPAEYAIKTVF